MPRLTTRQYVQRRAYYCRTWSQERFERSIYYNICNEIQYNECQIFYWGRIYLWTKKQKKILKAAPLIEKKSLLHIKGCPDCFAAIEKTFEAHYAEDPGLRLEG